VNNENFSLVVVELFHDPGVAFFVASWCVATGDLDDEDEREDDGGDLEDTKGNANSTGDLVGAREGSVDSDRASGVVSMYISAGDVAVGGDDHVTGRVPSTAHVGACLESTLSKKKKKKKKGLAKLFAIQKVSLQIARER